MTTTATTAENLRTVALTWPDLQDALGAKTLLDGFGRGLRGYLAALEQHDPEDRIALRPLERSPEQLGVRPAPISLTVHEAMRTVSAALHETATQIAATNQRHDIATSHPHRWRYTGTPATPWVALWLSARASNVFWPGRPLDDRQQRHLATVATEAARRVHSALDLDDDRHADLDDTHTCPCGGTIRIRGGAGTPPTAHCTLCGHLWTLTTAA